MPHPHSPFSSHCQCVALVSFQRRKLSGQFLSSSLCITFRFTDFSTCFSLFLSTSSQEISMLCNIILSRELWISSPTVVWINCTLRLIPTFSPSVFHKSPIPCPQNTKTKKTNTKYLQCLPASSFYHHLVLLSHLWGIVAQGKCKGFRSSPEHIVGDPSLNIPLFSTLSLHFPWDSISWSSKWKI